MPGGEPCPPPDVDQFYSPGISWDFGSIKHLQEKTRLTRERVDDALRAGAVFLEDDEDNECQYLFGFEPLPEYDDAIFVIVIEVRGDRLRYVTAYKATKAKHIDLYKSKLKRSRYGPSKTNSKGKKKKSKRGGRE